MSEPPAEVHWGESKRMIRKTAKNHRYCFDDVVVSIEEDSLLHSWGLYHRIVNEGCFSKRCFAFLSIVRLPCLLSCCSCFFLLECWIGRGCGCVRRELSVSFAFMNAKIYGQTHSHSGRDWNFGALSVHLDLALPLDRCLDDLLKIPPVKFHLDRGIVN